MMRFPFLVCMPLPPLVLLPVLLLPRLPTVMMKFPFHAFQTVLLWFGVVVMLRFLSRTPLFLAFPPPPPLLLFALNLPHRLAGMADALSGMVDTDALLLLPLPHKRQENSLKNGQTPHIVTIDWPSKTQSFRL
jgi:hypothetical protein